MFITDSTLHLSSQRVSEQHSEQQESLVAWRDGSQPLEIREVGGFQAAEVLAVRFSFQSEQISISTQAQSLQPTPALLEEIEAPDSMEEMEVTLLRLLVESLTGHKMALFSAAELEADIESPEIQAPPSEGTSRPRETAGWGLVYNYYESHFESESTSFSAEGVVHTRDGQEIHINIELNMSREFLSEQRITLRAGDAMKDPLVINFSGRAAELTQTRFSFDIDADGRSDQIAFVRPGSGFLALDKNDDGKINDGTELFGAVTGEGFRELAQYDEDGNNWIDENDSIYDRLRIWSKDANGDDQLVALGRRGVGAIYLGHIETPFLLKDADNQTLGQVRDTGLFLREEGGVGTVQQLDLVV